MFFHQSKKQETEAAKFQAQLQDLLWKTRSQGTQETLTAVNAALKINPNDANALFRLGFYYKQGRGVKQDVHEARRCYSKAAEQGHAEACYELAMSYMKGNSLLGIDKNIDTAKKYADMGLERGKDKGFERQKSYYSQLKALREVMEDMYPTAESSPTLHR